MDVKEFWERVTVLLGTSKEGWLADKAGVGQSTLSTWKTKDRWPRADQAVLIADALGVTVKYLVTGVDSTVDVWLVENRPMFDKMRLLSETGQRAVHITVHAHWEAEQDSNRILGL